MLFFGGDFIRIELLIIVILILIVLMYFYFIEPYLIKMKINNKNEYGSARFSTFNEIKKNFKKEEINNINEVGFPILYSKDNKSVWFDKVTPHYVYLGSTGSGKSVTCVIPMCSFIATAKTKRSVFITDPKGEIYHTTSSMFENNGYKTYTIDFRNPQFSNKINLLEPIIKEYEQYMKYDKLSNNFENDVNYINTCINNIKEELQIIKDEEVLSYKKEELVQKEKELPELESSLLENRNNAMKHYSETNRLITSLASIIMKDKDAKDPFWCNSARNLLEGLIGLFLEDYKKGKIEREQITLTSIKKFQNSSMNEDNFEILKQYVDSKPYGVKSKDSLTSIFASAEDTYKSIAATFGEKMSLFDDVNVANITSKTDFDFDILGKKSSVIYIIVPDEDKTYYKLITIIIGLLYKELVKLANSNDKKRLPTEIDWILDEFANCPPLDDIEAIVSVSRSRGMRFHFFIQSLSQLDNVYGKDVSQIILDNCGLVYLKTNTQETAEAISKRLGKKTIEANSISQSISKLDYNGNRSTSLMGRELLTPEEVKQLHYKTIIFSTIGYPIIRDTVLYNKFSCYKKGEVYREPVALKDLSYTYFTVEDIRKRVKKQTGQNSQQYQSEDVADFYSEIKEEFKTIITSVTDIINNFKYDIDYPILNGVMYCVIKLEDLLCADDIYRIEELESDKYHFEIENFTKNTIINIHKKL